MSKMTPEERYQRYNICKMCKVAEVHRQPSGKKLRHCKPCEAAIKREKYKTPEGRAAGQKANKKWRQNNPELFRLYMLRSSYRYLLKTQPGCDILEAELDKIEALIAEKKK